MFWIRKSAFEERVSALVTKIVSAAFANLDTELANISKISEHTATVKRLREEIETFRIERDRMVEMQEKERREIEHKIGLHRKQVEQDIVLAKREAQVAVREENLNADRKRFEQQMEFVQTNFTEQTSYLKQIIGDLAERLPSLKMTADVGARR